MMLSSSSSFVLFCILVGFANALPTTNDAPPCYEELADIAILSSSSPSLWAEFHNVSNPDWDGRVHVEPSFVALPLNAADVQRCLQCANKYGLRVAVKGGGHSFGGYSSIPAIDGFMINMAHMANVSAVTKNPSIKIENNNDYFQTHYKKYPNDNSVIDSDEVVAHVTAGAGARWRDVYQKFRASGENWVITGGLCPSVGAIGFTLGGGTGPSAKLHGLGVDAVLEFKMVTADGSAVLTVNKDSHPDLFWALRGGGGGNFGVVTEMTTQVFPGPDLYSWGTVCFDWKDMEYVLLAINTNYNKIKRTVNVDVISSPDNGVCLWIISMETLNTTRQVLAPIYETAAELKLAKEKPLGARSSSSSSFSSRLVPLSDNLQETDCWWEMIAAFAVAHGYSEYDDGPYYSKNCLVDQLSDELIATMKNLSESNPPPLCENGHHLIAFGGRVKEVKPEDTAFYWRNTEYMLYTSCSYDESSTSSKQLAKGYLDRWMSALSPFCNGGAYVNFIDPLGRIGGDERYYGGNVDRLRDVKRKWNPVGEGPLHFPMEILEYDL